MKVCTLLFVSCLSNRQYLDGYHSAAVFAQEWDWVIPLDNQLFSAWDKLSNLKVECAVHHCAVMVASGFVCGVRGILTRSSRRFLWNLWKGGGFIISRPPLRRVAVAPTDALNPRYASLAVPSPATLGRRT